MADTFLDKYLEYTQGLEPPTVFHQWTAVTVLAHALGRRVFFNQAGHPIYPGQLMTILVGPTGVRKSSAAKRGYDLIRQAKGLCRKPERLHPMPQRMSNESFFDCLVPKGQDGENVDPEHADCMGFLFASEFSSIANSNSYMEEIPEILTDMYDSCPGIYDSTTRTMTPEYWQRRFRKDGTGDGFRLRAPGVTLLACTTPTAIRETLPPHIRSTGFLARVIVAYASRSDRPANPLSTDEPWRYPLRDRLATMLARATELHGEARFTAEAQEWHDAWFAKERLRVNTLPEEGLATGFAVRSQAHAIRLAIVLAGNNALGTTEEIVIERDFIQAGVRWIRRIEDGLVAACGELAKDRHVRLEERVREGVRRLSQGSRPAMYRAVQKYVMNSRRDHWKAPEILEALERLIELRQVVQVEGPSVQKGGFRVQKPRPGPWTGTPAQGKPTPADEAALRESMRELTIQEEIEEGIRDKWGHYMH